jgi:hypothetical protein
VLPPGHVAVPYRPPPPDPLAPSPSMLLSAQLFGGVALVPGIAPAATFSLGTQTLLSPRLGGASLLVGGRGEFEGWITPKGPSSGGFGIPFTLLFGYRTPKFVALVGAGASVFLYDNIAGSKAVGALAPRLSGSIGLILGRLWSSVDVTLQRRVRFGADDHTMLQIGLRIGTAQEEREPR